MDNILDDYGNEEQGQDYVARVRTLKEEGYQLFIFRYISQAFDIFLKWPVGFAGFFLAIVAVNVILTFIPLIGSIGSVLINAPFGVGYAIVTRKVIYGETFEFADFFQAFEKVAPLFLASLVISLLVGIGFVFLIIPGVYLAVAYTWATLFIYFGNIDFWPAMELSREVITRKWMDMFLFIIVLFAFNAAGAILLGVGLLITAPVSAIAVYLAFYDVMEMGNEETPYE